MFNASKFLQNATVSIFNEVSVKDAKGAVTHTPVLSSSGNVAKIEHQSVDVPITHAGRELFSYYLLHLWADRTTGLLPDLKEGSFVQDEETLKSYEVIDIMVGSLFKKKGYKLEAKMLVMNDDRYNNFFNEV